MQHGLVVVLPGILGSGPLTRQIGWGLARGGVRSAIVVEDWTTGVPLFCVYDLRAIGRNRRKAAQIAHKVVAYQDRYPGRPVHLIGHSGGAGMAFFVAEALPEGRTLSGIVCLAAAADPERDLATVLSRTEKGVWNFHSRLDLVMLVAAASIVGTIDGVHTPGAGWCAFDVPDSTDPTTRRLYGERLHQTRHTWDMVPHGNPGTHYGWLATSFAEHWLAPIVCQAEDAQDPK